MNATMYANYSIGADLFPLDVIFPEALA